MWSVWNFEISRIDRKNSENIVAVKRNLWVSAKMLPFFPAQFSFFIQVFGHNFVLGNEIYFVMPFSFWLHTTEILSNYTILFNWRRICVRLLSLSSWPMLFGVKFHQKLVWKIGLKAAKCGKCYCSFDFCGQVCVQKWGSN